MDTARDSAVTNPVKGTTMLRKHGSRALGLSLLAVLGAMALAASAQANWTDILENGVLDEITVETPLNIEADGHQVLLVPTFNLEILCTNVASDPTAPIKLLPKSTIAHGHLLLSGCKTFTLSPLTEQKNCVPKSSGQAAGVILAGGLSTLILHNAKNYLLYEALGGLSSALVKILFGEACALLEEADVRGEVVFECGELKPAGTYVGGDCATERSLQLMRQASPSLFPTDVIKFGTHVASLDGIAQAAIGGATALTGRPWGGVV